MAASPGMNAATLAEVKRKAALGLALTNATADKQVAYNQTRSATDAEIQRKAGNGIALSNTNSAYNNDMYNKLVAAKNAANQPAGIAAGSTTNPTQGMIDGLADARKKMKIADLGKARDAAMSNLGNEKAAIAPKYYSAKNQAAAGNQQSARSFAEFMAARGGTNSGAAAQGELTRGMQLQSNLGELGRQETQAFTDIERRVSDLGNAYESDIVSANSEIEAEKMQAYINDMYQQQQRELQIAQLMGSYQGKATLDKQNQQWGQTVDKANLTGLFNGQKTAAQANQEWNNRFSYGNAIGQFSNGQQTLEGKQVESGLVTEQQSRDLATRNAALQEWQTTGYATPAVAAVLGVPEGTPTSDQSYRKAALQLDTDKFTYSQWSDAANAQTKAGQTVTAATAGDMLSQALQKVVGVDAYGEQKYGVYSDPEKREQAFVSMINTTGIRGKDVVTALTKAGYAINEINALQKEYPEVFQ